MTVTLERPRALAPDYGAFLDRKAQLGGEHGFQPTDLPAFLFPFQAALVEWALRQGRGAIFADCGLGKTGMQLAWADQVVRRTNRPVLILTPLAVSAQTVREGEKFGIEVTRSSDGRVSGAGVVVTNYERLHHFDAGAFAGVVCDESSILKSFDGARRAEITEFMRTLPYRLLCTATAAPNDYVELGTSSEALGELGHMDMLNRFFKNDLNNSATGRYLGQAVKWRFKGHAEEPFWRWVASWARAIRKPSDLGFLDEGFRLPPLSEREHLVSQPLEPGDGMLFALPAYNLQEQREERRRTLEKRCERIASLTADTGQPALAWCHLNDEGDLLERLIPGAVQVSGSDPDEAKEEKFLAFASGQARVLVTKPKIGAWGLNFQHCAHVASFASHSFEQHYQSVRRCWRFGQTRPVVVDLVASEAEAGVVKNLQRKADQASRMFDSLIAHMNAAIKVARGREHTTPTEAIPWLS